MGNPGDSYKECLPILHDCDSVLPTLGRSDIKSSNKSVNGPWEIWQPTIHPPVDTLTTNNSPTSGYSDNQQFTHQWELWQPTIHPPVGTLTTNNSPTSGYCHHKYFPYVRIPWFCSFSPYIMAAMFLPILINSSDFINGTSPLSERLHMCQNCSVW